MAVDTTVAGTSANSYLDVAGADAFASTELGKLAKAWRNATIEDKEAALLRATAEIDEYTGSGSTLFLTTQALRFPRLLDVDAAAVPFIPVRVRRATFLQASYLLANADVLDDAATRRARGLVNFSNPDGTGGQLADSRDYGRLHPRVEGLLADTVGGAVVGWIETT